MCRRMRKKYGASEDLDAVFAAIDAMRQAKASAVRAPPRTMTMTMTKLRPSSLSGLVDSGL